MRDSEWRVPYLDESFYENDPPLDDGFDVDGPWWVVLDVPPGAGRRALLRIAGMYDAPATDGPDPRATPEAALFILFASRMLAAGVQPPWRAHLLREQRFYAWHAGDENCVVPWMPATARRLAACFEGRAVIAALEEILIAALRSRAERRPPRDPRIRGRTRTALLA